MKGQAIMKHLTLALALELIAWSGSAAADDWTSLLAGDTLRGWEAANGGDAFHIKDGTLSVDGVGQIVYVGEGKPLDLTGFELQTEVLTRPGGRAGLAFHVPTDSRSSGGLEVRLDNSYGPPAPGRALLKTGSLVWLRPVIRSVVPDDRWFSLAVAVQGRHVQVWVDRQLVVDYVEPEKVDSGPRLQHGTLSVRGHDGSGAVQIRNLRVRPLAEGRPAAALQCDATDLRLASLREQGFAQVDYHTHLKGGLSLDDVLAHSRRTGIGAGVAVNCGPGFPVADDRAARAFLDGLRGKPVFVGMQAEGREWVRLFAPATVAKFDYVFTDAMTLTDQRGRRVRLWVKEEVDVPDAQAFMDLLVKTIENILDREPIDFYANPTYLPEVIAGDYDRLWTPERMRRVVAALARNGVALEINDRLRLPKPPLIKRAKEAGVKFTFGTNNGDRTVGRLEYGLRMIEECALTPDDLWPPPGPDGQKPIQVRKRE
jgi:hypothetical protein